MTDKKSSQPSREPGAYKSVRRVSRGSGDMANIFGAGNSEGQEPQAKPPEVPHVEAKTRDFGKIRALLAPKDCPPALVNALRDKVGKIGRFSGDVFLFQAGYDAGQDVLMICFIDVAPENKTRIEGAVADTLMASGYEEHALGILFLAHDAQIAAHVSRLAVNLKA